MTALNEKAWQLKAINEVLGDLVLTVEDTLTVGRGQDNDVVLGSKQVSRQHAQLSVLNGELFVKDLGSSNGTLINSQKIEPHKSKHLRAGDTVKFAIFAFEVAPTPVNIETEPSGALPTETTKSMPVNEPALADTAAEKGETVIKETTSIEPEKVSIEQKETDDYPVSTEDVGAITEEKLEEELEEPIPIGDPEQETHPSVAEPVNHSEDTVHTRHDDATSSEHFEELAEESDPEVLRAKQAATAKFSGTVDVNHDEPTTNESVSQTRPTESLDTEPLTKEPLTKEPLTKEHLTQTKEPALKDNVTQDTMISPINENTDHPVAYTQPPTESKDTTESKGSIMIWVILAIVIIAIAVWLFNSGVTD